MLQKLWSALLFRDSSRESSKQFSRFCFCQSYALYEKFLNLLTISPDNPVSALQEDRIKEWVSAEAEESPVYDLKDSEIINSVLHLTDASSTSSHDSHEGEFVEEPNISWKEANDAFKKILIFTKTSYITTPIRLWTCKFFSLSFFRHNKNQASNRTYITIQ